MRVRVCVSVCVCTYVHTVSPHVCTPHATAWHAPARQETDHQEAATIDPKWFEGLEEGVPVEHPLKVSQACRQARSVDDGLSLRVGLGQYVCLSV